MVRRQEAALLRGAVTEHMPAESGPGGGGGGVADQPIELGIHAGVAPGAAAEQHKPRDLWILSQAGQGLRDAPSSSPDPSRQDCLSVGNAAVMATGPGRLQDRGAVPAPAGSLDAR